MRRYFLKSAAVAVIALASCGGAVAQAPSQACQQLEAQLTSLDRGNADPARAEQIRRAEDAVNRQQYEVDRLVSQARRMGCERSGFFSIFDNPPAQCGGLNRQLDEQRTTLERLQNQLEQLHGGTTERAARRQSLLLALGQNNCGPQYRAGGRESGGFFERLFGNSTNNSSSSSSSGLSGPPTPVPPATGGTYKTVCVRTCDGYYFPISFATTPDHFQQDAAACQRLCPAAPVSLYTYHNPGEDMSKAVALDGQQYSALPAAFQYRKALSPACSCRKPGESWLQALTAAGADTTVAPGDVVVTEQNAKRLAQPRTGADGKPQPAASASTPTARAEPPAAMVEAPGVDDPAKRKVRVIGPTFLPSH